MAKIEKFEDLKVWQNAITLCKEIYEITRNGELSKDYKLINQIRASSGSIMDNIAEGFERGGKKEFIQFLSIAKGSAGELRSQLYRVSDQGHITNEQFKVLLQKCVEISKMIQGLIDYLKESEIKGIKYKSKVEEPYIFPSEYKAPGVSNSNTNHKTQNAKL